MLYIFFIWDKVVDPINWEKTQLIRGVVLTPLIWGIAGILFIKRLQKYLELIMMFGITSVFLILTYILLVLQHSYDYAEPGYIIMIFFMITLLPSRLPYYIVVFFTSFCLYNISQIYAGGYREGMLLINNMYGVSAIFLATVSVVAREMSARRQFKDSQALISAQNEVNSLLKAYIQPEELKLLKERIGRKTSREIKVAISYRRSDSDAIAGRIRDRLVSHFGATSIFMDIDNIPYGLDFRAHISKVLQQTDIVIAVIGPKLDRG